MGDDSRAAGARATGGGAEWCWWKWKARGGGGGGGEGRVRECPRRNGVVHPWVGQRSPLKCNVLKRELRREVPGREKTIVYLYPIRVHDDAVTARVNGTPCSRPCDEP